MPDAVPLFSPAARVLLIDKHDRLLLIRVGNDDAARGIVPDFPDELWMTPGGGEAGESFEQAALRGLREETGVRDVQLGPWVWTCPDEFMVHGQRQEGIERIFVVRATEVDLGPTNPNVNEVAVVRENQWWTVPDIQASDAEFSPGDSVTCCRTSSPAISPNFQSIPGISRPPA